MNLNKLIKILYFIPYFISLSQIIFIYLYTILKQEKYLKTINLLKKMKIMKY